MTGSARKTGSQPSSWGPVFLHIMDKITQKYLLKKTVKLICQDFLRNTFLNWLQ